ncbi:hypothetical protein SO802_019819 [Lithocarpus litseifolius]|uniref:non-specific serine/threonine protein kinase n=1 Tax=Lithocarpus litseifolius TaxID=425828 RepID=A0AAW2CPQ2_9ROSI
MNLRSFSYEDLEEVTGGFKEELGKGSFGTVYKGVLASSHNKYVAVRKLDKMVREDEREFKTDVTVIGQTRHKNLIRLLGYCDEVMLKVSFEVKAVEIKVSFAWDAGIRDVVIERNSKIVADTLRVLCTPPMVVSNALIGIANKLQDFRSVQVSQVKHQSNKPAHLLAKFAKEINNINYVT